MAACKSCGRGTGKEPDTSIHDGNEHFISYERGWNDPYIDLNKSYFGGECLRTDRAMEWAWAEAGGKDDAS